MISKRKTEKPTDPEEILTGICHCCKTHVELPRWQSRDPALPSSFSEGADPWNDLPTCECPQCKAKVRLIVKRTPST